MLVKHLKVIVIDVITVLLPSPHPPIRVLWLELLGQLRRCSLEICILKMTLGALTFRARTVDLGAFVYEKGCAEKHGIGFAQISPKHHQYGFGVLWRITQS